MHHEDDDIVAIAVEPKAQVEEAPAIETAPAEGEASATPTEDAEKAQKALKAAGETVYRIGVIEALPAGEALCVVR